MTGPTSDDYTNLTERIRGITHRTAETWMLKASLSSETRLMDARSIFEELTFPMILDQAEAIGVLAEAVEALARKIAEE